MRAQIASKQQENWISRRAHGLPIQVRRDQRGEVAARVVVSDEARRVLVDEPSAQADADKEEGAQHRQRRVRSVQPCLYEGWDLSQSHTPGDG